MVNLWEVSGQTSKSKDRRPEDGDQHGRFTESYH